MDIGLIADTHDELVPWDDVLAKVADAFEGVELILHCGDLTTMRAVEDLSRLAPVMAVRSPADPPAAPPTLREGPHLLEAHGAIVGLVNTLGDRAPADLFDRPVDVVVHGGTHEASITWAGEMLLVNPGSPSLADRCSVARLEVGAGAPRAEIIEI